MQTLNIPHIHRGIDVDPGFQQLVNILIAFSMAAVFPVGVGQLIHQDEFGSTGQGSVQIKGFLIGVRNGRKQLQAFQKGQGFFGGMGCDIPHQNVYALGFDRLRGFQHGLRFSDTLSIAEKDFQLPFIPLRHKSHLPCFAPILTQNRRIIHRQDGQCDYWTEKSLLSANTTRSRAGEGMA